MPLEKPKILESVKGKNGVAKITTILIAIGLLAVPFVLLLTNEASAAIIVSEDFEDITEWTQDGTISVIQSTWAVHSGTYSVHLKDDSTSAYGTIYQNKVIAEGTCTIDFWLYYNATGTKQGIIMLINDTGGTENYKINLRIMDNNTLNVQIIDAPSASAEDYYGDTVQAGSWTHIICIVDNGDLHVYQDGTETINASGAITPDGEYTKVHIFSSLGGSTLIDMYIDDLTITDTADYPGGTETIDIVLTISPDSDGDGRISFGSTNQTNVSMDSIDFINITENGDATVTTITITMQTIGGVIPTYYGGTTNCYVYKWIGTGEPTSVDLSDTSWQQVASFNSSYQATITGLSLGQGQSIYIAFRILDNDPEDDGLAAGTYESTRTAHSITAS